MKRFVLMVAGLAAVAVPPVCAAPAYGRARLVVELHGVRVHPACPARGDAAPPPPVASYRTGDDVRAGRATISTAGRVREEDVDPRRVDPRNAVVTIGDTATAFPKEDAAGTSPPAGREAGCPPS